jgi:hypothetical protein
MRRCPYLNPEAPGGVIGVSPFSAQPLLSATNRAAYEANAAPFATPDRSKHEVFHMIVGFIELRLLIKELFDVANLTGNAGKTVKRLMDRTFGAGLFVNLFKMTGGTSALGFALYLQQLKILIEQLQALEGFDDTFTIQLTSKFSEGLGSASVFLKAKSVPEGMRARQALLREGRHILENFTNMEELELCDLTEGFLNHIEETRELRPDEGTVMRGEVIRYFEEFMQGDITHAEHPYGFYGLAQLVNPSLPDLDKALAA